MDECVGAVLTTTADIDAPSRLPAAIPVVASNSLSRVCTALAASLSRWRTSHPGTAAAARPLHCRWRPSTADLISADGPARCPPHGQAQQVQSPLARHPALD